MYTSPWHFSTCTTKLNRNLAWLNIDEANFQCQFYLLDLVIYIYIIFCLLCHVSLTSYGCSRTFTEKLRITTDETKNIKRGAILEVVHFPIDISKDITVTTTQVWRHIARSVKTQWHQQLRRHRHYVASFKATDIDAAGPVSERSGDTSSISYESE